MLTPPVPATREAVEAIAEADGSSLGRAVYTSLPLILLPDEMAQALRRTPAPMVFIDNLGKEHSPAARRLSLAERTIMERYVGKRVWMRVIAVQSRYQRHRRPVGDPDAAGGQRRSLSS